MAAGMFPPIVRTVRTRCALARDALRRCISYSTGAPQLFIRGYLTNGAFQVREATLPLISTSIVKVG